MKIKLDDDLTIAELMNALGKAGVVMELDVDTLSVAKRTPGEWKSIATPPPLLRDVLITLEGEEGNRTEMGFLRRPGEWYLTGTIMRVHPIAWMHLPAPYSGDPI